jgi:hypothetical protein
MFFKSKNNINILPFSIIHGLMIINTIDYKNQYGHGNRAIVNKSKDQRKVLIIANSI